MPSKTYDSDTFASVGQLKLKKLLDAFEEIAKSGGALNRYMPLAAHAVMNGFPAGGLQDDFERLPREKQQKTMLQQSGLSEEKFLYYYESELGRGFQKDATTEYKAAWTALANTARYFSGLETGKKEKTNLARAVWLETTESIDEELRIPARCWLQSPAPKKKASRRKKRKES